jgi:hypothetical protein
VVNFEIGHRAASLASPAVASQHLVTNLFVRDAVKSQNGALWAKYVHDAFMAK